MNVLIITKTVGNIGGLARYSQALMKHLNNAGVSAHLLVERPGNRSSLIPLEGSFVRKFLSIIINCYRTKIASRHKDVVHALDGWPYSLYAYAAVIGTKKRLFITGIGTYTLRPLQNRMLSFIFTKIYYRASAIFAISHYVRNQILRWAPLARVEVVHLGVNTLPSLAEHQRSAMENKYQLHAVFPLILTVGDIKDRKGQLDTLKAVLILRERYPSIRYMVIGIDSDKYYVSQMKELAASSGHAQILSIISNNYNDEELSFFYNRCDVYALNSTNSPSFFEGFGLSIIEAASFGIPAVGSRNCGIEDAIINGSTGYLTEERNPKDIAEKIQLILTDNHANFQKSARTFSRRFSWETMTQHYIKAYNDSIGSTL